MKQGNKLSQKQELSARTLLSSKILQMSSLEIIDFVNEQSLENPVMEFLEERLGYGEGSDILEKIKWLNKKSLGSFEKSNIGIYEYDNELWDLGFGEADDLSSHILMQLIPNIGYMLIPQLGAF